MTDIKDRYTILNIPKDIQIYCCHFLNEHDLQKLDLVCKCLCDVSRDPNSIYHLTIIGNDDYHLNKRYSRIKSLDAILLDYTIIFNDEWNKTLVALTCDQFPESCRYLKQLQKCLLCEDGIQLLIKNRINYISLKHLEITDCKFDKYLISAIIQCVNLEQLSLDPHFGVVDTVSFDELQINEKLIVFPKLIHFEFSAAICTLSNWMHLFLNNNAPKILHISRDSFFCGNEKMTLFHKHSKLALLAFRYIQEITFNANINKQFSPCLFLKNIGLCFMRIENKKLDHLKLIFHLKATDYYLIIKNIFNISHQSIIPYCIRSTLYLYFGELETNDINQVLLNTICETQCRSFQKLQIHFSFQNLLHEVIYDELDPSNISNQDDLYEKSKQFANTVIIKYNEYIKPWLIITKDAIHQIDMKYIAINLCIDYDIACMDPLEEDFENEYFHKEYQKLFHVVQKTWIDHVYPVFVRMIKTECNQICKLNINCHEVNISFTMSDQ